MAAKKREQTAEEREALSKLAQTYEKLKEVRASTTLTLKPSPYLRTHITDARGKEVEFKLRYYQCQGIYHLLAMKRMILGDGTGLGKCQIRGTIVLSDEGLVPIESFAPSPLDLEKALEGFYDMDREVRVWTGSRMARVRRFYWSGKKPTVRVTTRNGYRIEGTLVHPMRVRNASGEGWMQLQDIKEGDFLCVDRSEAPFPKTEPKISFDKSTVRENARSYTYPEELTPDLATLLGYIVSEGNRTPFGVVVTQDRSLNPEPHDEIRELFRNVFGWSGNESCANRDTRIHVSSVGIKKYLAACGVGEELSREKSVPPCILRGSRESVRGFLSAMIEAEGFVAEGGVEFSSSSEALARGVQLLLLRFGVVSTLSEKRIKGNDHTYWRLSFFGDDARLFQEAVGFRSSRKADLLREGLAKASNPNKDLVPHMVQEVGALKKLILQASTTSGSNDLRKGSGIKQFGGSFQSTLKHVLNGHRDPSYLWLVKLMSVAHELGLSAYPEYEAVLSLYRKRHFYDPIVKIESCEAEVMDIEVDDPEHCYIANGLLSHNTIQVLGALAYLWPKEVHNKAIVVTPKSALLQWAGECLKFTKGVRPIVVMGSLEERQAAYEEFLNAPTGPDAEKVILLINYAILVRDWDYGSERPLLPNGKPDPKQPVVPGLLDGITAKIPNLVAIFDEATAFKNPSTKTWQTCRFLSDRASRCYGLTATLLKNRLIEGFAIYKVIVPNLFSTKSAFMDDYCIVKLQPVPGGRKVPVVVGYRNLDQFRQRIDPFFLGRPKHAVSNELPKLITKEIVCELSPAEDRKYSEALSGLLELGDGDVRDYEQNKALTALIYCQQIANSLSMLKFSAGDEIGNEHIEQTHTVKELSSKESALMELLTGELDGEKTIVYTRFASLIPRLQELAKKAGIKSVAITGKVSDKARRAAQDAFQDLESDTKVVFISDAASEAINLQAASSMVFFDAPWSWGTYVQLLGRPIRIGSVNDTVVAYHLVAERPGHKAKDRKTIDRYTLDLLGSKKDLVDKVLGESAVGALEFEKDSGPKDLLRLMQTESVK